MGQKIELGKAYSIGSGIVSKPKTLDEQIALLEKRIATLTRAFNAGISRQVGDINEDDMPVNKDGIPINISLIGQSMRGGIHVLTVTQNKYLIGTTGAYDSLSAAAEAASGIRRSGWTFWKLPNGKTVKEVYGKTNG